MDTPAFGSPLLGQAISHALTINDRSSSNPACYDREILVVSSWQSCARARLGLRRKFNPLRLTAPLMRTSFLVRGTAAKNAPKFRGTVTIAISSA